MTVILQALITMLVRRSVWVKMEDAQHSPVDMIEYICPKIAGIAGKTCYNMTRRIKMTYNIDKENLYEAFRSRDVRFDGQFFVGVSSTGIYCRPVCTARMPKKENCTFYHSAAEAEANGYRPCMICRPELAPGVFETDASLLLAKRAARYISENCSSGLSLTEAASALGCTDRHLRRVFEKEYGVTPVQYLQTCRLLLAKNLLTETSLSVLEVALASGFGSVRQFNHAFRQHYNLSPLVLRKNAGARTNTENPVTVTLGYRPPYRYRELLAFFEKRAIPGVEVVRDGKYYRTVRMETNDRKTVCGWISVSHLPKKNAICLSVSDSLLPVMPKVVWHVKTMFDLFCDPEAVASVLEKMNEIRSGLFIKGTRIPGAFEPFEMSVRSVLGQQITVHAAGVLAGRFVSEFGTRIETGMEGLTHLFPEPEEILSLEGSIEEHLGPLGIIASRARTIRSLARAFTEHSILFESYADPAEEKKKLLDIKGIGPWTADYIAMRSMADTDVFLGSDAGVKKALGEKDPKKTEETAKAWSPWRSYATVNLWNSLYEV